MICKKTCFLFILLSLSAHLSFATDSVLVCPGRNYQASALHSFIFGKHYRKVWLKTVRFEVFDISSEMGGLKPKEKGGNFQTVNLRLVNDKGKEYVLRCVDKDPARALPPKLRSSFVAKLFREQNSAENLYGPLILPVLSDAIGIFHTNPKIVFIPHDKNFGDFEKEFGGRLALFEERPSGDWHESNFFGNSKKIVSSPHMFKARYKDISHMVDERSYAKCRLFDMLIGDWGRHEDQWRWASYKSGNHTSYLPIPRDRDHAFYRFSDGVLPWMASRKILQPKLQSFKSNFGNVKGLNESAEFLDTRFLNSLSKKDWLDIADSIKMGLSDEIIEASVRQFPAEIYAMIGEKTASILRSRRDQLDKVALQYYKQLSRNVEVTGSDTEEKFYITRKGKETTIKIFSINDTNETEVFSRTFHKKETKKIILRGLGGNDVFEMKGSGKKFPALIIIGNEGADMVYDSAAFKGIFSKTKVIVDANDQVSRSKGVKIHMARKQKLLNFDRKGFKRTSKDA
jgi:hypothetical protein